MKSYYRVMLGRKSAHAPECFASSFIGADFGITEVLSGKLPESWRAFNQRYVPTPPSFAPSRLRV